MPTATIGHVTRERYEQIIAADRELVGQMQRIQFTIGDHALEIEPMQQIGGAHPAPGEDLFGVDVSLQIYADDLGLSLSTVRSYRFAAHRWPAGQRRQGVHCRDHERLPEMSESLITWAAITLMTRRLTRRKTRPAERRDVGHGYVMPEAA
ncbi:hypothetical protein OH809_07560 [Streptomyces sp. NBC_00873]|nr:hypothetical protein OH809_07560 [Streptomyces sp. NBC_00873]WTA49114.1 hypothetical protein OH821_36245 [Streptomyces sp. NBC_00842]